MARIMTLPRPLGQKLEFRIDHLWMIGVLSAVMVIVSRVIVYPNDFWWHLKIGQLIYQSGSVPTTNLFAWTLHPNHPYTYGAWLGEYLIYLVYHLGGLELTIFIRNLLIVIAFALIGHEAYRRSGSWKIAAFALSFSITMSAGNLLIRTQIWAFLPFTLYYLLLSRFVDRNLRREWLLLLPLMMMFWVNVHGSFILGEAMLGIFIVGEAFRTLRRLETHLEWKEIGYLGLIAALNLAAMLVNPLNLKIFGYVVDMMTDQPSQNLIMEWQSPAPKDASMVVFFLSIVLFILIFAYARYKPAPTEMMLVLAFLWLAWTGLRYVLWYSIIAMPVLAAVFGDYLKGHPFLAIHPPKKINQILAFIFVSSLVAVQPWFLEKLPLTKNFRSNLISAPSVGPLLHKTTPVGAAEYLEEHPGGRLFNDMAYGSYLIWAVPEQRVFIDPRVELYPYQQWLDYIDISAGNRYNTLLQKYGADRILLDREEQVKLSHRLQFDPEWQMEYQDRYAEIWSLKN